MKAKITPSIVIFLLLALVYTSNTRAAFIAFNDKNEFLNYVGSVAIDDLEGIRYGGYLNGERNGYSWSMHDHGCKNSQGCEHSNENPFITPENDWVWTFGDGTFDFDFGITAFGFEYVEPFSSVDTQVALNGFTSELSPTGSFFGIASTDGSKITQIVYEKYSTYGGFDNVVYSTTPNNVSVSEPLSFALLGLGILGIGLLQIRQAREQRKP